MGFQKEEKILPSECIFRLCERGGNNVKKHKFQAEKLKKMYASPSASDYP